MADFETSYDLKLGALERSGELQNGTSDYDQIAEDQINDMNKALHAGGNEFNVDLAEPWEWAKAKNPGLLKLVPAYETGTATLTEDSTSGTFNTAPAAGLGSFAGRFIRVSNRATVYRITAHTAGSGSFTIDQAYLEETVTAVFVAFKTDYELAAGIERLIDHMRFYGSTSETPEIGGLDLASFNQNYPRAAIREGLPSRFGIVSEENGLMTVRFNAYPSEDLRVEYEYILVAAPLRVRAIVYTAVDATANTLTFTNHGFQDAQQVQMTGSTTVPAGLTINTPYFIRDAAANTFKLALTEGGTAIDITTQGTGTHTFSTVPRIPASFRKVLMYAAIHFIMVDKRDSRADYYGRQTQAMLAAMLSANRKMKRFISKTKGQMLSRRDSANSGTSISDRIPWIY